MRGMFSVTLCFCYVLPLQVCGSSFRTKAHLVKHLSTIHRDVMKSVVTYMKEPKQEVAHSPQGVTISGILKHAACNLVMCINVQTVSYGVYHSHMMEAVNCQMLPGGLIGSYCATGPFACQCESIVMPVLLCLYLTFWLEQNILIFRCFSSSGMSEECLMGPCVCLSHITYEVGNPQDQGSCCINWQLGSIVENILQQWELRSELEHIVAQ